MKKFLFAALIGLLPLLSCAAEESNLKCYVSFDGGTEPEIAAPGVKLRLSETPQFVEGKYGKAIRFRRADKSGDLLYDLGTTINGDWTLGCWIKLDRAGNRNFGSKEPGRYLFRTGFAWKAGNIMAGFDNWGKFMLDRFDADGNSRGLTLPAAAFPANEWIHVAFTQKGGAHAVFINGNEATYSKVQPVEKPGPKQNVLRIGSLDTKDNQLEGAIDELKIFDRALSAEEVKEIMDSTPGKRSTRTLLFDPFQGEIAPAGAESFSAAELVFPPQGGVKVVRHGYDRKGILKLNGVPKLGGEAVTVGFRFTPDWDGASDAEKRGLFFVRAGGLQYGLAKTGGQLVFSLEEGGVKESVALDAGILKPGRAVPVTAGFDRKERKLFLTLGDRVAEKSLPLRADAEPAAGSVDIGDLPGHDTYSPGQMAGTLSDLLIIGGAASPEEWGHRLAAEQKKRQAAQAAVLTPSPELPKEAPLWKLDGAETISTATRDRIALNALWRFQLTGAELPFDPSRWEYLAVPGRYSGHMNGMSDSEFFRRNAELKKLPRNALYHNRSEYHYVNGWFERAFRADPAWKNRQIALLIDELSRSQQGTVFLNGRELAKLPPGGAFFEIPIPPERLKFGEDNFLTIHVVDSGNHWAWRGIKGDVALLLKPFVSAEYPGVVTSVAKKEITFELTLKNRSGKAETLYPEARITGEQAPAPIRGEAVTLAPGEEKQITFGAKWPEPRLWSPDTPYLYTAKLAVRNAAGELVDEPEEIRFGFREFEIRGRDYYLNGNRIHLFNHDGWASMSSDLDEARRVARTLKKLGYNSVRTLFPVEAKDNFPANIMRVCDEEGLLQFVGLDGVTGREFAVWNDPAVRRQTEERMAGLIRRYRNHASNVMYFLSSNFLGYGWDYHPLKMADGYTPKFQKTKYDVCMQGVEIMRKYDSSRPFFFQAGGNFGPVITNNAYFCWWPQAERNAWPEVWSKIGQKPLHIIETGFPYFRSFSGMDLKYSEPRPLFYYENLARYYGPEVYLDDDPEMLLQTARSAEGKLKEWSSPVFYDSPLHQRLRSDLVRETIPLWRGFDISGVCPFAELYYTFRKNAPHRSEHTSKTVKTEPGDFRRFGWHPDLRKFSYQADINPEEPLPFASALAEALAPRLVRFDGGPDSPADKRHNYSSGETMVKGLLMINDTQSPSRFSVDWKLTGMDGKAVASGKTERTLAPGELRREALTIPLPEVASRTVFRLESPQAARPLEITVFPKSAPVKADSVALYDETGRTAATLRNAATGVRDAQSLKTLDGITLLIVGRESLTPEFTAFARKHKLAERIDSGRLNLLICEQKPEALAGIGLRSKAVYARDLFPSAALSLPGLEAPDYRNWAGDGTLAPAHQPPAPETEESVASPLWHWTNRNSVAAYPLRRPVEGDCRILLSCGKDLVYTPLLEMRSGKGTIVFSQLETSGRTTDDPAAERIFAGLLERYACPNPVRATTELLAPRTLSPEEFAAVRRKVEAGAVLLAPPGSYRLFGLDGKTTAVNRFAFTPAGKKLWPDLTARDGFLRAPQSLTVLSGSGLVPLTDPAFAAELALGKGKVFFLEIPDAPGGAEKERGAKEGPDSSVGWSAEILAERFLQLKNRLAAAHGAPLPSLAERLEQPLDAGEALDLNGQWSLRVGKDGKEESVTVPGYYNFQLPHHNEFVGVAVYRRSVRLPEHWKGHELLLDLGAVDDTDETFVNGVKVGATGEETPGYWSARRMYPIPAQLTRSGKLDLAVHAGNLRGNSGITGHARLVLKRQRDTGAAYPYSGLENGYDTETHIRW